MVTFYSLKTQDLSLRTGKLLCRNFPAKKRNKFMHYNRKMLKFGSAEEKKGGCKTDPVGPAICLWKQSAAKWFTRSLHLSTIAHYRTEAWLARLQDCAQSDLCIWHTHAKSPHACKSWLLVVYCCIRAQMHTHTCTHRDSGKSKKWVRTTSSVTIRLQYSRISTRSC